MKADDYRANMFLISGMAMMSPLGHLFLDPRYLLGFTFWGAFLYLCVCGVLFYLGLVVVFRGCDILRNKV